MTASKSITPATAGSILPVENIELLSRYGSDSAEAHARPLGGGAWQSRKARLKKRLLEMAGQLIRIAAERRCATRRALNPPDGLYGEFSARFPYEETDDQQTRDRLRAGRPVGRPADGPADLRRCRLRQDRGGAARRLHRGDGGLSGGGRGADHAAGAPALQDVLAALFRTAGKGPAGLAAGRLKGAGRDQEGHRRRHRRYRRRHACAARQRDLVQEPRPADHRRGAAFRRQAQGAAEGAEERRACADAVGDADPAHAATGADRRSRTVADRHAAGRPHGGAHLHLALRPAGDPRDAAARALSRRPELLCRAAHRRPCRRSSEFLHAVGAGAEGRHRPWPDAARRARRHHERLLRRPVRRAAVDHRSSNPASTSRPPTR